LLTQGQWWSSLAMQVLQSEQCLLRAGLEMLHVRHDWAGR
jgi:hypothetical protein